MSKKIAIRRKERRKKYFAGAVLLLMILLTIGTVVLASGEKWEENGSYSLIIKKVFDFDENTPEEIKEEALKQEYTFKIEGTREISLSNGEIKKIPVSETITLPRKGDDPWTSETFKSHRPFHVIVTEITDNIELRDDAGKYYNMSDSTSDAATLVDTRKHELNLRNNSRLTISRSEETTGNNNPFPLWYHIVNRPETDHPSSSFEKIDTYFPLNAGEKKEFHSLRAGIYTIEQIVAPDGYQLQMGTRTETVPPNTKGHFYINGTPGRLTLTAGGNESDDVLYYYIIERTETEEGDTSKFQTRKVSIQPGKSYVLDNLPRGGYTVTEYTVGASEQSKVTTPTTDERTKTAKSSGLSAETKNTWKYMDLNYDDFDVDYIKMVSFGPLYNSDGNKLNSSTSYATFRYGIASEDGKLITGIKSYSRTDGFTGNLTVKMSDAAKTSVKPQKKLYFTAIGVKSTTAKTIGVSWIEYDEKETEKIFSKVGTEETITVDERGWMKIEAPALKDPGADGADKVAYYYTIKDAGGNLITGETDDPKTSVKLLPGNSTTLENLNAGSYTITETMKGNSSAGFTMEISGNPFGTTEKGKDIIVKVGGSRNLTITKPAPINLREGAADNRTYSFNITGTDYFSTSIGIKAGERITINLPKEGTYHIRPMDTNLENYHLNYTDSGAIYGTAKGSQAVITFTNVFSSGEYGYRYVHEYYVKKPDGSYEYEGNSPITTKLGRDKGETYEGDDISKVIHFNGNEYKHFSDADAYSYGYGYVDGLESKQENQTETNDYSAKTYSDTISVASPSSAKTGLVHDSDRIFRRPLPTASPSSARINQSHNTNKAYHRPEPTASPSQARSKRDNTIRKSQVGEDTKESFDDTGIISKGIGKDSSGNILNYEPNDNKDHIEVTPDASQIIILRYYREQRPMGKYNVIHVYYYRDETGDHREGNRPVQVEEGELGTLYNGNDVEKECTFIPNKDNKIAYTYEWDERPQYGELEQAAPDSEYVPDENDEFTDDGWRYRPNNDWKSAKSTEEGNQIIILRYYREKGGCYNIVHEYYFREKSENHDSMEDNPNHGRMMLAQTGDLETGDLETSDLETGEDKEDNPDKFTGTLVQSDGYVYTFEGSKGDETNPISAPLNDKHYTANEENWELNYNGQKYTHLNDGYGANYTNSSKYSCNSNQEWVTSTENGEQVIILRYYREDKPDDPEPPKPEEPKPETPKPDDPKPDDPKPPSGGGGRNHSDPKPTPTTVPESVPEIPTVPVLESVPETSPVSETDAPGLPDPNLPGSPESVTILENGVPKTYIKVWNPEKEEFVYLPEDEVPLSGITKTSLPRTSDNTNFFLWISLVIASFGGIIVTAHHRSRKKN